MYQLQNTHPDIWEEFDSGGFTVQTNLIAFTVIGIDQAQEHVNRGHKGDGGVSGITNNPEALLRYCLSTRLSGETEKMLGMTQSAKNEHHDLSEAKLMHREKYIKQVKEVLSNANPFRVTENTDGTELKLVHLTNKMIMPSDLQDSIIDTEN
jgi:hypothetical protein